MKGLSTMLYLQSNKLIYLEFGSTKKQQNENKNKKTHTDLLFWMAYREVLVNWGGTKIMRTFCIT